MTPLNSAFSLALEKRKEQEFERQFYGGESSFVIGENGNGPRGKDARVRSLTGKSLTGLTIDVYMFLSNAPNARLTTTLIGRYLLQRTVGRRKESLSPAREGKKAGIQPIISRASDSVH